MPAAIIRDLQPDWLNLGAEPDTMADLSGLKEFNDIAKYTDYVNYVLKNVDRSKTRIIAGIGTWGNLELLRSLAANTSLDALDIHIYPVQGQCLTKAIQIAEIASQYKKGVVLDECWLYKVDRLPTSGVAAASDIFRRDAFSFWEPLDQQFLAEMAQFSRQYKVEYLSPFWSSLFFGNLDYNRENANLPYTEMSLRLNKIASENMLNDKLSPTGEFYRNLIRNNR